MRGPARADPRLRARAARDGLLVVLGRSLLLAGDLLVGGHADVIRRRRRLGLPGRRVDGDRRRGLLVAGALAATGFDVLLDAAVLAAALGGVVLLLVAHGAPSGQSRPTRSRRSTENFTCRRGKMRRGPWMIFSPTPTRQLRARVEIVRCRSSR